MSLSSLKRYLPKPPPRHVVLLPDAIFFTRSTPVTEGATAGEVAQQIELAVEGLSPFPIAQIFYGFHWLPGATHALVYAAYRKRITSDEVDSWSSAEVVLPSFVSILPRNDFPQPGTVWVIRGASSLTGVYFADASGVPSQTRVDALPVEAGHAEHAAVRETLLRAFPEKRHVVDLEDEPRFDEQSPQSEFIFKSGARENHLDVADAEPLDVRDKDDLRARRRAHKRDLILWRVFLGSVAVIGVCLLLELALVGAGAWQNQRLAQEQKQRPVVEGVMTSQTLATRIEELSTKRLHPFEMLAIVNQARPRTIQFMKTTTSGLYTLEVEAQTSSSGDIDLFRSALSRLPACEKAEVLNQRSRDGLSTFQLSVVFRPEALRTMLERENPAAPVEPTPPMPAAVVAPKTEPTRPPVTVHGVATPSAPATPVPVTSPVAESSTAAKAVTASPTAEQPPPPPPGPELPPPTAENLPVPEVSRP